MHFEQLPRMLISLGLGFCIGLADLYGLFLTVKYYANRRSSASQIPLAFLISEMIRLFIVLGILLVLSFQKGVSFGWLVSGPLLCTIVKYVYAFRKLRRL